MNGHANAPTALTFATNWDVQLCHYQCQENSSKYFANTMFNVDSPDCLGFSLDSNTGTDSNSGTCYLYYNGACTKSADGTKTGFTYYTISGFLE